MDAEEVVVNKAEVHGNLTGAHFAMVHAAAHAVEGHGDYCVAGLPADRTVFDVVQNRPNAALGLDEGLELYPICGCRHVCPNDVM